jgi:7-keto-8-aminopelargonate synthetase-like enzyme
MRTPLEEQVASLSQMGLTRFFRRMLSEQPELLMKNVTVEAVRPDRWVRIAGRWVRNFGSDSFLGLDQHPQVKEALIRGVEEWGTHNGTSRAFSSVQPNVEAERRLAQWLGAEAALIYPSVSLANIGALPALTTRHDVIVADQYVHNSMEEGMRIARARGVRCVKFAHNDPHDLERCLRSLRPYRRAVVALDGVYSMSGQLPPLVEFQRIALNHNGFLYVDDAHGTGVVGPQGRGTVWATLGNYHNVVVIGSLSKALSCLGGFAAGSRQVIEILQVRSQPLIFGGPVPPPYLTALLKVLDIMASSEYIQLRATLDARVRHFVQGARRLGLVLLGGCVPIVSVLVGAEEKTLHAGRFLFEQGYYVQSVVFPAVPHGWGVLRVQLNANHSLEAIDGLLAAFAALQQVIPLPQLPPETAVASLRYPDVHPTAMSA